ncbi:MAG: helix-turn-helix domain-containing protein [Polyangiales bacterium]
MSVGDETRARIVETAERLFAEQGMAVSNRQIGEAAGQANNSVVGYHFGTKADLIAAIVARHTPDIEARRSAMLAALPERARLRPWLLAVVKPITDHLASLDERCYYARFLAQVTADPTTRGAMMDLWLSPPSMRALSERAASVLPSLPMAVFIERSDMMRHIVVHVCAERERALQSGEPTPRASWDDAAQGIVDALAGLWRAPQHSARVAQQSRRAPRRSTKRHTT